VKFVILGAGMQGTACAHDLVRNKDTECVTMVDQDADALRRAGKKLSSDLVETRTADCVSKEGILEVAGGHDVVISALPYRFNPLAAEAAIEAGASFVDMGGNIEAVLSELRLSAAAREAQVTVVPDCGLAPGLANVLVADAAGEIEQLQDVEIRVGGLPENPRPPWNYRLVFSFEGLINEYTGTAAVLRDWNRTEEPALAGLEEIVFPEPLGRCEAAFTSGGSSTLPWTFAGRIRNLDYKTVRYPGHFEKISALEALGFFATDDITVGGQSVAPRDLLRELFNKHMTFPDDPDLVVLRVVSRGVHEGKQVRLVHEMMDRQDQETGLTAMMRTTAFPVSIVAQLIADGSIERKGAFPPEQLVPPAALVDGLEERGVFVRKEWKV